jgi:hypothetical protein
LPAESVVNLLLYNSLGQEVKRLVDAKQQAGTYSVALDMQNYPSDVYFYRLIVNSNESSRQSNEHLFTKKLILIK